MSVLRYNLNLLTMVALDGERRHPGRRLDRGARKHRPPPGDGQERRSRRRSTGAARSAWPRITITLVDVVVYVPMAVMTTGLPAQFLQPFAVVITAATLSSLLVSFTLTPMLARLFLREGEASSRLVAARTASGAPGTAAFCALERGYEHLLRVALPRRWLVIAVGLASFAAGMACWRSA